jgi:hypothetical protein
MFKRNLHDHFTHYMHAHAEFAHFNTLIPFDYNYIMHSQSKKSAALQFGEKELLVTYYKDAGSSLPAHNTRGESGNVHEDDVTIIDPSE